MSTADSKVQDKGNLGDLIVHHNYSLATSWFEDRYSIWRKDDNVQGYIVKDNFAFAWGDPIVSNNDNLKDVVKEFINSIKPFTPVFCCVSQELESLLATDEFKYRCLTCVTEDVLNPTDVSLDAKDVQKNVRRSERAGVSVREIQGEPNEDERNAINEGVQKWKAGRKGEQIATASIDPFLDSTHRRFFIAKIENKIVGILILTLIHDHGYQIKNCTAFVDSPKGTSERLIVECIETLKNEDVHHISLGVSTSEIHPADNIKGLRLTWLSHTYNKIVESTGISKRADFRVRVIGKGYYIIANKTLHRISSMSSMIRFLFAIQSISLGYLVYMH